MFSQQIWRSNQEDEDGDTKLHFAAASGQQTKLLKYLKLNFNVNSVNKLGWTPLMQACRNGHLSCAKSLIEYGADVSYKNKFGVSSLCLAAASGNVEIVHLVFKSLVEKRITIFELEKVVSSPVFSILFNYIDVLRYFINHSFDLRRKNFFGGVSAIQFAKILNKKEIMSLLKRRGLTPLSINVSSNSRKNSVANSPILLPSTPSPTNNSSIIPSFITAQYPTPINIPSAYFLKTPNSGRNPISPRISPKISRHRKCSNISATSIRTPSISPISINNSSLIFEDSCINLLESGGNKSAKKILNQRFSISPHKLRFSSTSSTDSINSSVNFLRPDSKVRSLSFYVPATPNVTPTKEDDEVFDASVIHINRTKEEFIDILRKNSLDSCISLFEKHEIDMDLFLTLSKNDLEEIGVDWDKRDTVLEVIYHLNKQ